QAMVCVGRTTFPMPSERRKGGIFPKRSGRNNFGRPFIIYASALSMEHFDIPGPINMVYFKA
ncbi:hypothetical protein, partial [Desulfobacter curvatus]|uniref:hypothetical protein n=1 Tax=Desulfobacter curvatus TaxID=2290 RepID=UPI000476F57D